jgi:hypothetical protein
VAKAEAKGARKGKADDAEPKAKAAGAKD